MLTRRHISRGLGLAAVAPLLAACPAGSTTTDAQVLADASGAVSSLNAVVAQFAAIDPKGLDATTLTEIQNGLKIAQGLIASLSTATPAASGASTLAQVDSYLNAGLTAIASVLPVASAAFPALMVAVPIVDAIIALLPGIENWVNPLLTSAAPKAAAALPLRASVAVSPAQARKALGIPTMR